MSGEGGRFGPVPKPLIERLLSKIEIDQVSDLVDGACWVWKGGLDRGGYGQMGTGSYADGSNTTCRAHRLAYESMVGPIPEGLKLAHSCLTRACCNPDHLVPRGPLAPPPKPKRATCPQGHAYDRVNVRGSRVCSTCQRAAEDRYRLKAKP